MRSHGRSRRVVCHFAALGALAVPGAAFADGTCGPGQTVVDPAGHCCSPGQVWSDAAGQCASLTPAPATAPVPTTTPVNPFNMFMQGVQNGDPTAPVSVTFVPGQPGDQETLQIQPITGAATTCTLPCVVSLPPGYVTLTGSGQRTFETAMNVPPFDPLTVQINHFDSPAPLYVTGGALLALGLAGSVGSVALLANGAGSCGVPVTSAEEMALAGCTSAHDTDVTLGGIGVGVGITAIIVGSILLANAAHRGQHPVSVMQPGQLSRPLAQRDTGWHFAGIEPDAIPGGAMIRAGITF